MTTVMPQKVLVIDDELGPRESIRFLLKNEFDVLCAESVDKGVGILREREPDLVILDIRMPEKNGIQGLREIRQLDPHVSVIMLTGYGALETAQEALRLGANDYLNKPFDTDEMIAMVRHYVHRARVERRRALMLNQLQEINQRLTGELQDREQAASLARSSAELAHDMRNPLMIVSGYVELLTGQLHKLKDAMGDQYDRSADYLEVIAQNVRRCCELSRMWQKFGKDGIGEWAPVTLSDLIEDVALGAAPLAALENVKIEYHVSANGTKVRGSRAQLIRAIHNLISNAIHAVEGKADGRIVVSCSRLPEQAEIQVADNGVGMTPEVKAKAFEPYFTTKQDGKGTGLGLSITRRIIADHNGTVAIQSAPDRGTTLILRLPLYEARSA